MQDGEHNLAPMKEKAGAQGMCLPFPAANQGMLCTCRWPRTEWCSDWLTRSASLSFHVQSPGASVSETRHQQRNEVKTSLTITIVMQKLQLAAGRKFAKWSYLCAAGSWGNGKGEGKECSGMQGAAGLRAPGEMLASPSLRTRVPASSEKSKRLCRPLDRWDIGPRPGGARQNDPLRCHPDWPDGIMIP